MKAEYSLNIFSQPGFCGIEMKQFILTSHTKLRPTPCCERLCADPIKHSGNAHWTSGSLGSCREREALVWGCCQAWQTGCVSTCLWIHTEGLCTSINWACFNRTLRRHTSRDWTMWIPVQGRQWELRDMDVRYAPLRNTEQDEHTVEFDSQIQIVKVHRVGKGTGNTWASPGNC